MLMRSTLGSRSPGRNSSRSVPRRALTGSAAARSTQRCRQGRVELGERLLAGKGLGGQRVELVREEDPRPVELAVETGRHGEACLRARGVARRPARRSAHGSSGAAHRTQAVEKAS